MALRVEGEWVWDFWTAHDGEHHHLFYLHAPQSPQAPDERHHRARIGHAVSSDLRTWLPLPEPISPGPAGSWDDGATWTGSVVRTEGGWAMLYTGASAGEHYLVQRIGVAFSDDLTRWTKHPGNPVLEVEPTWYEVLDLDSWHDQAWRDPAVVFLDGVYHAFITARENTGPAGSRGVIARATSRDLVQWTVEPPVVGPQGFGYLEVPQVLPVNGRWYLVFSAPAWAQPGRPEPRYTGIFQAVAEDPAGPYVECPPLYVDTDEGLYGGRLIEDPELGLVFLAFRYLDPHGRLVGEIIDPVPVTVDSTHRLRLASLPEV